MKKNIYIAPTMSVTLLSQTDGLLTSLSGEEIQSGGSAEESGQNEAGVKGSAGYNVWSDDWSN